LALERTLGPHSATWGYTDAAGNPAFVVIRWDATETRGKEIRPITQTEDGWVIGHHPTPRPLYRLPDLVEAERVVVVEGEKCADQAWKLGFVATTSASGAKAFDKSDWTPLAGKDVFILPDRDEPGNEYAHGVAGILGKLNPPARVRIVPLPGNGGDDIVDFCENQDTATEADLKAQIEALMEKAPLVVPGEPKPQAPTKKPESFPTLHDDAWPGILGEIRSELTGKTEADPNAVLLQLLAAFGNALGRGPHVPVERDRHAGNLFCVLVGSSAKGRKGTSLGLVRDLVAELDLAWNGLWANGLSSGEGLIFPIRDPRETSKEPDPGCPDKRLLIVETEFGRVLRAFKRESNTLSAILRDAWDGRPLRIMTKTDPMQCREPHVSIVGHITSDELRETMASVDVHNGLFNRFLWAGVRRGTPLPRGGSYNLSQFRPHLVGALETGKQRGRMDFVDDDAREYWGELYRGALSEDLGGLAGALTARSEPQVLRLALLYAILDGAKGIRARDLGAAAAVWDYCRDSAIWAFGMANLVNQTQEERILAALGEAGPDGLTGTQVRDLFHRPRDARVWRAPMESLLASGKVRMEKLAATGGRPTERYFLVAT